MRQLFVALALAGCTTVSTNEAPCACIVHIAPEQMNGVVSLALDGHPVDFARFPDQRMPTSGVIFAVSEGLASGNGLDLSGAEGPYVNAEFGAVIDLNRPLPVTRLDFAASAIAGIEPVGAPHYELGPEGGTLQVDEVASEADGGYRIRGGFRAQVCPRSQASEGAPCRNLEGRFAFSRDALPEDAITGGLLAGGA